MNTEPAPSWPHRINAVMQRDPILRVLRGTFVALYDINAPTLACAMAFEFFLALLPMLALATWIVSHITSADADLLKQFSHVLRLAPDATLELVEAHRVRFPKNLAPLALAGALWLASGPFHGMMTAFEDTGRGAPRSWLRRRFIACLCVLALSAALGIAGLVSIAIRGVPADRVDWVGPNMFEVDVAAVVATMAALLLCTFLLAAFFRIGVRSGAVPRRTIPGSATAVFLSALASWGFAVYARTLSTYALYYGSLAAVVVVLLWLWLCSLALLLGAEINTQLEQSAAATDPVPTRNTEEKAGPRETEQSPGSGRF